MTRYHLSLLLGIALVAGGSFVVWRHLHEVPAWGWGIFVTLYGCAFVLERRLNRLSDTLKVGRE